MSKRKQTNHYDEAMEFHRLHPQVLRYVDKYTREAIAAGYTRFAIGSVWERIRWEVTIVRKDIDFKMPNNHRAYYSRMWMERNPQHKGFFRTAMLRSQHPDVRVDRYGRVA